MLNLLTKQEVCEMLHISKHQLARLTAKREIPYVAINKKSFRYDPDDLKSWLHSRKVSPGVQIEPGE